MMNDSLHHGINRKLRKIDKIVWTRLDQILPKNLTVRYIAALTAVAILAISGQLIIQTSLAHQREDQKTLRSLESQIRDSENLRKAVLAIQLRGKAQEIKAKTEVIESLASQFQVTDETGHKSESGSIPTPPASVELIHVEAQVKTSLKKIIESCHALNSTVPTQLDLRSNLAIIHLLNYEANYRSGLKEMSKYFSNRLERQITDVQRIELFLLLMTLAVLVIEALYVFRPGVESVYDALRIRSEFLGRMGHEMRNPMNSILGMTNLLFETSLNNQQKKYLSILQKSSVGLLEVLNHLLDFSSIESGTLKKETISFDLYSLLERSIDLAVFGAHANGIELILDLNTNVPLKLIGDPGRLQQILTNLLGNAVKFTQIGEVVLKVELLKKNEQALIQFSVIDTGMGIDKQKIDRIFDAFVQEDSTVRRRFGGTGLGLSISKDLVKLLGGNLAVESQKNKGSCFYFALPFTVTQELAVENSIRHFNFQPYQALIIEPNDSIYETVSALIRESAGQTSRIKTLKELTDIFSEGSQILAKKEVIIVDFEFSKETLPIFLSKIRRGALQVTPFIFLIKTTALSNDIEKLAEYGLKNFLFKPVKPLQLVEAISQVVSEDSIRPSQNPIHLTEEDPIKQPDLIHDDRLLRVLAVDDSKDNQFLVKAYLRSLPYRITFADNGKLAVEKFKSAQFDIILMDLQMPEMDGYTATQIIREWECTESLPPTPVIAVSAHDNESGSDRFKKAQFSAYLLKPISPNQLRKAILNFTHHIPKSNPDLHRSKDLEKSSAIAELEKQLADLAPQYLKSRRQDLISLRKHLEEFNYDFIQTLGHKLKGNAKSYGFEELGLIGAKLEEAARNRSPEKIQQLIGDSEHYLNQFS